MGACMGRRNQLISEYQIMMKHDKKGSFLLKQERKRIMKLIVNDLQKATSLPASWKAITLSQIYLLVQFWKRKGLSPSTVSNRLAVLRVLLNKMAAPVFIPNNKDMGITKSREVKRLLTINKLEEINEPYSHIILGMQSHFGLTKKEAVRLRNDYNIFPNEIFISRNIAFNHCERWVPIWNEHQEKLLVLFSNVLANKSNLLEVLNYHQLNALYRYTLQAYGMASNYQYRYLYAISRIGFLSAHYAHKECIKMVQKELGFKSSKNVMRCLK